MKRNATTMRRTLRSAGDHFDQNALTSDMCVSVAVVDEELRARGTRRGAMYRSARCLSRCSAVGLAFPFAELRRDSAPARWNRRFVPCVAETGFRRMQRKT